MRVKSGQFWFCFCFGATRMGIHPTRDPEFKTKDYANIHTSGMLLLLSPSDLGTGV